MMIFVSLVILLTWLLLSHFTRTQAAAILNKQTLSPTASEESMASEKSIAIRFGLIILAVIISSILPITRQCYNPKLLKLNSISLMIVLGIYMAIFPALLIGVAMSNDSGEHARAQMLIIAGVIAFPLLVGALIRYNVKKNIC